MPELRTLKTIEQDTVHIMGVSNGQSTVRVVNVSNGNVVVNRDGIPKGGHRGDLLAKKSDVDLDTEWITPANAVEEDNTKPITSAAVYTEIGNINALLATI